MSRQLEIIGPFTARAAQIWRELERIARPAYFLTWGWVENWLLMLPEGRVPKLAVIREAGQPVGAFFLGRCTQFRYSVLPSHAAYVNATGVPNLDELCIEHNGILGSECSLATLIELMPDNWDELFLPGVVREKFRDLDVPSGYRVRVLGTAPSPFVDLAQVRAKQGDYLSLLSSNTRAQIRRARRRIGACDLDVASSLEEAFAIYEELVVLHAASWRARGKPGVFADPWFDQFHRQLIQQRFVHGEIELVRLRNSTGTVGCLYNLVANGRVLFYQSGLAPFEDPVIKPGLVCHAAAIEHCAAKGHAVYDLLGGSSRYKDSLATGATELAWLCVQRERLRFAIEDRVRAWKNRRS